MTNISFLLREKAPCDKDFDYAKLSTYSALKDEVRYMGKALAQVQYDPSFQGRLFVSNKEDRLASLLKREFGNAGTRDGIS